jgi:glycine/D-amino acid oxidase-like deaminating enzyme
VNEAIVMPALRLGAPLWLAGTPARRQPQYRPLDRDLFVDVVVVGGGITGAAIAGQFAAANVRVAVLEARQVARGSTAANTALLMQEPDKDFGQLAKLYGSGAAKRIWHLSSVATRDLIATLRRLDIDCDLVERDSIYYTTRPDAAEKLHAEHRLRRAAGFGGRWLGAAALRRSTGIEGAAGIRSYGNAQCDPYRACLGLMRTAKEDGALIFERSAVRLIRTTRSGVAVVTRRGTVFASQAVIATGYATPEFKPLAGRFAMKHTYVLTSQRIATRTRARLGLGDVMLWDTARPYHYARWTPDHRLILGGGDRAQVPDRRRASLFRKEIGKLRQHFEELLPSLRGIDIEYAWAGLFAITPDGLPYIGPHRRYPRHLFALGYGGNGMTFGFLAARLLVDRVLGARSADLRLFSFGRHR